MKRINRVFGYMIIAILAAGLSACGNKGGDGGGSPQVNGPDGGGGDGTTKFGATKR